MAEADRVLIVRSNKRDYMKKRAQKNSTKTQGSTDFIGVTHNSNGLWQTRFSLNGKRKCLATVDQQDLAAVLSDILAV